MNRIELSGKSQGKGRNGYFQLHGVELMKMQTDPDGQVLHFDFYPQRAYCFVWRTLRNWRSCSERRLKSDRPWQTLSTASWCAGAGIEVRRALRNRDTKSRMTWSKSPGIRS